MTQEKAIEYLKGYLDYTVMNNLGKGKNDEAIQTVLNMLKEKDAEIERLKEIYDNPELLEKGEKE